jgi:hypothetical protein
MSADKEKLDQLGQKVDEILAVLKVVSDDLKTISSSIKSMAVTQITSGSQATSSSRPAAPISVTSAQPAQETQNVEDIRMLFSQDLDSLLIFEDKGDHIMIKPKQFLGSENFAKIASTVRGIGGEYISAGRDSHFRVYKKKT